MRRLQLIAHGEPSDVVELNTVSDPDPGPEEVLVSMEAAPLNPSDFLLIRGRYGVRPAFPFSVGAEGVGRVTRIGSKVDVAFQGKRVLILPTYEQGTWADQVLVSVRNIVPISDEADPLQLAMIGINPATAYLLLNRYVSLMPGDWIGQTAKSRPRRQFPASTQTGSLQLRFIPGDILLLFQMLWRRSICNNLITLKSGGVL
jgi:NADPH:quinone reductase-like Zn-dependent oxidoreductase